PQIIIAATNNGIWRSSDGGASWTLSLNLIEMDLEFKPGDPNVVYAAGYYGFYISNDAGISFSPVVAGIPNTNIGGMSIAVTEDDPNYVYAITTSTTGGYGGFYR